MNKCRFLNRELYRLAVFILFHLSVIILLSTTGLLKQQEVQFFSVIPIIDLTVLLSAMYIIGGLINPLVYHQLSVSIRYLFCGFLSCVFASLLSIDWLIFVSLAFLIASILIVMTLFIVKGFLFFKLVRQTDQCQHQHTYPKTHIKHIFSILKTNNGQGNHDKKQNNKNNQAHTINSVSLFKQKSYGFSIYESFYSLSYRQVIVSLVCACICLTYILFSETCSYTISLYYLFFALTGYTLISLFFKDKNEAKNKKDKQTKKSTILIDQTANIKGENL